MLYCPELTDYATLPTIAGTTHEAYPGFPAGVIRVTLPDQGDTELVGSGRGQSRGHPGRPMAIGVSLDHGEDLAGRTNPLPNLLQIEAQSGKVDFDPGRAGQGRSPSRRTLFRQ